MGGGNARAGRLGRRLGRPGLRLAAVAGAESRRAGGGRPTPRRASRGAPSDLEGPRRRRPVVAHRGRRPRLHPRPAGRGRSRARPLGLDRRGTLAARLRSLLRAENRGHPVRPGSEVDHAGGSRPGLQLRHPRASPGAGRRLGRGALEEDLRRPLRGAVPGLGNRVVAPDRGRSADRADRHHGQRGAGRPGRSGRLRQGDRRGSVARRRAAGVRLAHGVRPRRGAPDRDDERRVLLRGRRYRRRSAVVARLHDGLPAEHADHGSLRRQLHPLGLPVGGLPRSRSNGRPGRRATGR